jgi:hypothetical protein|uniref:hypothetical protein n=1 Tax=Prevotella sp. TaxID=59823 RepID=UPI003FF0C05E
MATIYKDVEVKIDTDEIWEEVLDDLSTEEIEEYLEERRKNKTPVVCTLEDAESGLLDIAQLRLSPNLLCCKDSVKRTINEIMDELWS